jgi:hypothetical protein
MPDAEPEAVAIRDRINLDPNDRDRLRAIAEAFGLRDWFPAAPAPPRAPANPLNEFWLFRDMAPMMIARVAALPDVMVADDPAREARRRIANQAVRLQAAVVATPEGRAMDAHMAALDRYIRIFRMMAGLRPNGEGVPEWLRPAQDLAVLMEANQRVYVRHLVVLFGIPFGEEYWADVLPRVVEQVEDLAQRVGDKAWEEFPLLHPVLVRWRLAARGDVAALVALPALAPNPAPWHVPGAWRDN